MKLLYGLLNGKYVRIIHDRKLQKIILFIIFIVK